MTKRLLQAAAVLAIIASPALAQSTSNPRVPSAQNSGAGIPGASGSESGTATGPQGNTASDQTTAKTRLQDAAKIPGKAGGKSGPAVTPPSRSAQSQ